MYISLAGDSKSKHDIQNVKEINNLQGSSYALTDLAISATKQRKVYEI